MPRDSLAHGDATHILDMLLDGQGSAGDATRHGLGGGELASLLVHDEDGTTLSLQELPHLSRVSHGQR